MEMAAQSTAVTVAGCSDMPASVYCEIYFLRLNQKIIAPKGIEADMVHGAAVLRSAVLAKFHPDSNSYSKVKLPVHSPFDLCTSDPIICTEIGSPGQKR